MVLQSVQLHSIPASSGKDNKVIGIWFPGVRVNWITYIYISIDSNVVCRHIGRTWYSICPDASCFLYSSSFSPTRYAIAFLYRVSLTWKSYIWIYHLLFCSICPKSFNTWEITNCQIHYDDSERWLYEIIFISRLVKRTRENPQVMHYEMKREKKISWRLDFSHFIISSYVGLSL